MTFADEMKILLDQFAEASKDFALKTGEKAKEMGEHGMLLIDIKKTESKIQKLMFRLGGESYRGFIEHDLDHINRDDPIIEKILAEIAILQESINRMKAGLN